MNNTIIKKEQLSTFVNSVTNIVGIIEKDKFISLALGETFVNDTDKGILYKVDFLNALGYYSHRYEILEPRQSITKTNILNKVKIFI